MYLRIVLHAGGMSHIDLTLPEPFDMNAFTGQVRLNGCYFDGRCFVPYHAITAMVVMDGDIPQGNLSVMPPEPFQGARQ